MNAQTQPIEDQIALLNAQLTALAASFAVATANYNKQRNNVTIQRDAQQAQLDKIIPPAAPTQ